MQDRAMSAQHAQHLLAWVATRREQQEQQAAFGEVAVQDSAAYVEVVNPLCVMCRIQGGVSPYKGGGVPLLISATYSQGS
jgi:hypothetical protein